MKYETKSEIKYKIDYLCTLQKIFPKFQIKKTIPDLRHKIFK